MATRGSPYPDGRLGTATGSTTAPARSPSGSRRSRHGATDGPGSSPERPHHRDRRAGASGDPEGPRQAGDPDPGAAHAGDGTAHARSGLPPGRLVGRVQDLLLARVSDLPAALPGHCQGAPGGTSHRRQLLGGTGAGAAAGSHRADGALCRRHRSAERRGIIDDEALRRRRHPGAGGGLLREAAGKHRAQPEGIGSGHRPAAAHGRVHRFL